MKRELISSKKIDESYSKINHPSGLTILLYPMSDYSSSCALFGTKYGSIDSKFKINGEKDFLDVPDGIAHFLEHKLFEGEEGDAFSLFAKTGAFANAFTSFEKTCYLFSCVDKFYESLKILLSFVRSPYFTQESVEKEQGIIGQEIEMYNDSPGWRVFFNLLQIMYFENPIKIDIAGTKESISKIDEKILYKCYNTFYNLNNMVLCVAGNFEVDKTINIINENVDIDEKIDIVRQEYNEVFDIRDKEISQKLRVSIPMFNIGYKCRPLCGRNLLKSEIETNFILDIIFGESSEFYRKMYEKGLINNTFGFEVLAGTGYFCFILSGESKEPKKVFEEIKKEIEFFVENKIKDDTFNRCKRSAYGQCIRGFSSVESIANQLVSSHFGNFCIYDSIDIISELSLESVNKNLSENFNNNMSAISIIDNIQ